jgi:carboxypeptidase Taq
MPFQALRAHLAPVQDLRMAANVLEWDQETYMPEGGATARAHQVATLRRLAHEAFTAPETARLLEAAEAAAGDLDPHSDEAALVRVVRRDLDKATRLPARLVSELAEASAHAKEAWKAASAASRFSVFAPHLERLVALSREQADRLGYTDHPYDALLDLYEPGATTADVATLFESLRQRLVPLVQVIAGAAAPDDTFLHAAYPEDRQWAFMLTVLAGIGYDLHRGRLDVSAHPFTTTFSIGDVRLTTRVDPHHFPTAFFGMLHEAGHGLYEQGIAPVWERTPLAEGASLGVHESQSRLWENLVGRAAPFWRHYFPQARQFFPEALAGVEEAAFVAALNRVQPSHIRVEADEVTYPLHVLLRFEVETALMDGSLAVADVPARWNERFEALLGLAVPDDAHGCLQDVHWALGAFGYFPTYTLGTLMSVQLFEAARRDLGDLPAQIGAGDFAPLLAWLRTHVHQYGRARTADEIVRGATGGPLSAEPWLAYVEGKFGALYGLDR